MEEVLPACQQVGGTRWVKVYSGAGALSADITILWDMESMSAPWWIQCCVNSWGDSMAHRFENGWVIVSPRSDRGVDPGAQ